MDNNCFVNNILESSRFDLVLKMELFIERMITERGKFLTTLPIYMGNIDDGERERSLSLNYV